MMNKDKREKNDRLMMYDSDDDILHSMSLWYVISMIMTEIENNSDSDD